MAVPAWMEMFGVTERYAALCLIVFMVGSAAGMLAGGFFADSVKRHDLVASGGLLVAGSCSMHLARADLMLAMQQAAVRAGCQLRVVEQGAQGPDHPIHPAIPETEYLKAIFARKI